MKDMLKFPERYFEDEVRSGFYVPGKMKRFWASQLEIMAEIDRICRKYNITYFAEWGTMLGVVRHHGFIPWDDDTDLCMKREDYVRFLAVAPKELSGKYSILNYKNNDDYWDVMARVLNSDAICFDEDFMNEFHQTPYVSGVDIFPMDYLPRDKDAQELQKEMIVMIKTVADMDGAGNLNDGIREELLREIECFTGQKIDREKPIREQLYYLFQVVYAMYTEEESDALVQMGLWVENGGNGYKKELYDQAIYMPFENIEIPVPIGYDTLLRQKYGDYMRLVKGGGNSTHDYPLYSKQEADMESAGVVLPKYAFNRAELEIPRNSGIRQNIKSNAQSLITLFKKVTAKTAELLNNGHPAETLELLKQCQDGAINLGNTIEQAAGEDCRTVKLIEEYCELIFQVYQGIVQGAEFEVEAVCGLLMEQLNYMEESAVSDIHVRRVVCFLPFRADAWNAMSSLYEKEKQREDTDVYVIPIPYFYKDYSGNAVDPVVYDLKSYPSDIETTSYEAFDFEQMHPDVIYIQNPYDNWNDVTSVHPFFYSTNIKRYTDELVYVPYFKIDEIDNDNFHETTMEKYYITVPGVVNADKVIVQSERMKNDYVGALTDWAGEETREIWEKKIFGTGLPLDDIKPVTDVAVMDIPDSWKEKIINPDGSCKKVMLYSTSISSLLEKKDRTIDKMKRSFEVFSEQKDRIALIYRPQSKTIENLGRIDPETADKYIELMKGYISEGWGIYDDLEDEGKALSICDAFYGSGGELAQQVRRMKKPVMLQNIEV